jgi:hypothetical protein
MTPTDNLSPMLLLPVIKPCFGFYHFHDSVINSLPVTTTPAKIYRQCCLTPVATKQLQQYQLV